MSESKSLPHLIVGAGALGIITANDFHNMSIPAIVFEKTTFIGGVWNRKHPCGLVNTDSRVQIPPNTFRFLGDNKPLRDYESPEFKTNLSYSMYGTPEEITASYEEVVVSKQIHIEFQREVVGWKSLADGTIEVEWVDLKTQTKHVDVFGGLHFRTGSQQFSRTKIFPGEASFRGSVGRGVLDDVSNSVLKGKDVVIIGMGATAIDNATRALFAGAKSITFVARNPRPVHTMAATYLWYKQFDPRAVLDQSWLPARINEFAAILRKAWKVTDSSFQETYETFVNIAGVEHIRFTNGFFATRGDAVLLGIKYGLVKIVKGEVASLNEDSIVLENGESLHADVLFKCLGYGVDRSLLKGHVIVNGWFVDMLSNVTSTLGTDFCHGTKLSGPLIADSRLCLANVHYMDVFNKIAAFYISHPDVWKKINSENFSFYCQCDPSNHDYLEMGKLFGRAAFSDPELAQYIITLITERSTFDDNILNHDEFLRRDKLDWERTSKYLSDMTGKPLVPYPYEDEFKQAATLWRQKDPVDVVDKLKATTEQK